MNGLLFTELHLTLNLTCVCKISSDALNIYNPRKQVGTMSR